MFIFLSMFNALLRRSTYFIFRFSARPFSGSFREADAPPVCFLPRLARKYSAHYLFIYKVYLNTLDIFLLWIIIRVRCGQSLEGSAPLLRVLIFFYVSDDFFGGVYEVVREYFQLIPRELASLSCPIYLGISALVAGASNGLLIVWWRFFLRALSFPSVSYYERGSKILGGNASLHLRESSPCPLFSSTHDREGQNRLLVVPKFPNFPGVSPKFSKVLLRNC